MERVVIVGAGLAGLRSAEALRERGYTGQVTLIGAEPHLPYERPPLSKALLRGEVDDTTLEADWDRLGVELRLEERATALRSGTVDTDRATYAFDGLVIATGAEPTRLPGDSRSRLLRTVDDARALRGSLRPGTRLVVVGAGWIGAEVATAAAAAGCRVTVVEAGEAPLATAVGAGIGRHTESWYAETGVALRLGAAVASVEREGVQLADGELLPADEVLVAVGVRPAVAWLAGSGVTIDGAVVVDESLRTSMAGIVAVGDCADWWSPRFGARVHVEHWDDALRAPDTAAAVLLGAERAYDPVPYFWSEQHGRMLQYVGYHPVADELLWRGDPRRGDWAACWLRGERLVALLSVDRPRDMVQARKLIASGRPVDRDRLADPAVRVRDCATQV
ncbi:MAG: NAD(P)/FAD-dependent oxidoreductase [Streptosporangiaceae bacterium]